MQPMPCLRAVLLATLVTLVSMVYLLGFDLQTQIIRPATLTHLHSANANSTVKDGYLVWSPSCQIPDINPRDVSIRKLLKPAESIVCSRYGPLTYVTSRVLKVDAGIAHHYVGKQNYSCCYSHVLRNASNLHNNKSVDNSFYVGNCTQFKKEVILPPDAEFVLVQCKNSKGKKLYSNIHALIPIKPQVALKLAQQHQHKPSVLIIGVDSVSRLSFIRTMTRTLSYFKRKKWVELRGYNKIGDNTFPNLLAILTGMSMEQVKKTCSEKLEQPMDDCPYVWKEFSDQGYVTVFGEDETEMNTFNYHKPGFINPPTDYYLRPFLVAAEKKLPLKKRDNLRVCMGPMSTTQRILDYATDIASTFRNVLYFALLWINNLTHNNANTFASMDYKFLQFFMEMEQSGSLNNTIVIFLSDHGMRFGKIRETLVGWYEERLPFIHMWVPEWFRNQFPQDYNNLLVNSDRLTSPYDLHLTLKDIATGDTSASSEGCPNCMSLFQEVPYNRSCSDAGVSTHWCTCDPYEVMSTVDMTVQSAAKYIVSQINSRIRGMTNKTTRSTKCAQLKLKHLVNARRRVHSASEQDFVILFETAPGKALFESTVRYFVKSSPKFKLLGIISRINMYWSQSWCATDSILKLYCYCVKS